MKVCITRQYSSNPAQFSSRQLKVLVVSNLETRRVDRNETVGVGNCSADRVISSASGEAVEHSVELSIDAASLHLHSTHR